MTQSVDLNELRERTLASQNNNEDFPASVSRSVFTDSEGNIVLNPNDTQRPLSKIPLKTFAGNASN
jgi:hypothetical protein